ncbi:MAG: phosphatidate cytidylyltransferase [Ignavibacteria bacterium]|jgi:phosphatidate cytidylyltransferase|nr:phosphatidate cytidylyltransferase [Ignavibacteria bacterium]
MSELTKRILVAVIGIPLAIAIFYIGGICFDIAFAVVSSIALWEFYNMAEKKGYPTFKLFGIVMGILPFVLHILYTISDSYIDFNFTIFDAVAIIPILLFVFITGTLVLALLSNRPNAMASIGAMFTAYFEITISFVALVILRDMNFDGISDFGFYIVILLFTSIWLCDSAAYFIGRKFGKHKLYPSVSPKKSVEGAIAGFIASAVWFPVISHLIMPSFNIIYAVILGIAIGIFGQIGDLVESKLKRDADIKDSSNIIPGHGGILDRFDSIIFTTPIILIILIIIY